MLKHSAELQSLPHDLFVISHLFIDFILFDIPLFVPQWGHFKNHNYVVNVNILIIATLIKLTITHRRSSLPLTQMHAGIGSRPPRDKESNISVRSPCLTCRACINSIAVKGMSGGVGKWVETSNYVKLWNINVCKHLH